MLSVISALLADTQASVDIWSCLFELPIPQYFYELHVRSLAGGSICCGVNASSHSCQKAKPKSNFELALDSQAKRCKTCFVS
jgi:hypothetical protein